MIITKGILIGFGVIVLVHTFGDASGAVLRIIVCVLGALIIGSGLFLERNFRRFYGLITLSGTGLAMIYLFCLVATKIFYPAGYLWMGAMMIGLISFIKYLQNK